MSKEATRRWVWRCVRGLAWFVLAVILLIVCVREYVDWSGRRRWAAVQAAYAREGESLDFRSIMPDPVPDNRNFCAIPALKDLPLWKQSDEPGTPLALKIARINAAALPDGIRGKAAQALLDGTFSHPVVGKVTEFNADDFTPPPRLATGALLGQPVDMAAWAAWLRKDGTVPMPAPSGNPARDIVVALAKNDPLIKDLATGLNRPESQWTPPWKTRVLPEPYSVNFLPYQFAIKKLQYMLCLRATAAAHAGDTATADQSVLIALRLNQAEMEDPFLIGSLISCANSSTISNTVWELCDAKSGTDADFQRMQEQLERLDYQKSFLFSVRSEVTVGVDLLGYLNKYGLLSDFLGGIDSFQNSSAGEKTYPTMVRVVPDGWYEANTATIAQWYLDYYIKPLRDGGFKAMLPRQQQLWTVLANKHSRPIYDQLDDLFALMAMPEVRGVAFRVIYTQSQINEAIAACALERYRIEHGAYPASLQAANHPGEKILPLDVISGKPMGYRRTPNGRYLLWCVALNNQDHGGTRVLDPANPATTKFADPSYTGDWVWDFPPKH